MQFPKIKISEAARSHIGVLLFFLNISVLLVCHATGVMGIYMKQEVSSISDFLVFYNTSSLFKLLLCVSLLFLVFHLMGAKIFYDSAFNDTRERFHSVLFYWIVAGCALFALCVAAIIVLTAHQDLVLHAITLGFKHVMKQYKVDPAVREYINLVQIEHQCCGATAVSDWFKVSWVDVSDTAPISHLVNSRYMESNGEFLPRWAPFSCCRQDFIGAPCESVWMFFHPVKNPDWIKKSKIYSIDYLAQYGKYKSVFKDVSETVKNPPASMLATGRRLVSSRRVTFDTFLRGVTGHRDVEAPAPRRTAAAAAADRPTSDNDVATARTLLEAQGVKAQSYPDSMLRRLGEPPWTGPVFWSYDNISTAEAGNLQQLLQLDGRDEQQTLELLAWRSFNQVGCAEAVGHTARLTMRASSLLFIYVAAAQLLIILLGRYLQTSMDTAYRWGNPMLSAPGYLFSTSQPMRPQDRRAMLREGKKAMASLVLDTDEDTVIELMSPSWTSAELEEPSLGTSTLSSADVSASTLQSTRASGSKLLSNHASGSSVSSTRVSGSTLPSTRVSGSTLPSTRVSGSTLPSTRVSGLQAPEHHRPISGGSHSGLVALSEANAASGGSPRGPGNHSVAESRATDTAKRLNKLDSKNDGDALQVKRPGSGGGYMKQNMLKRERVKVNVGKQSKAKGSRKLKRSSKVKKASDAKAQSRGEKHSTIGRVKQQGANATSSKAMIKDKQTSSKDRKTKHAHVDGQPPGHSTKKKRTGHHTSVQSSTKSSPKSTGSGKSSDNNTGVNKNSPKKVKPKEASQNNRSPGKRRPKNKAGSSNSTPRKISPSGAKQKSSSRKKDDKSPRKVASPKGTKRVKNKRTAEAKKKNRKK